MNLIFVEQELARAERFVVPWTARTVLGDVSVDEPRATGLEIDEGVADVCLTLAESFDLGAMKDQSGFELLQEVVIVRGGAILGDDLFFLFVL
jgi:hypothetical protein